MTAQFHIEGPYRTDSQTVWVQDDSRMMIVKDSNGNQLGIEFQPDGTFAVGTWEEDGSWRELTLMDHNDFGNPFVAHLDQYKSNPKS